MIAVFRLWLYCDILTRIHEALAGMTTEVERLETELTQVRSAISSAMSGAEYEIESGGTRRRLKRQSLKDLQARESMLVISIARLDGSGSRGVRHGVSV